MPATPSHGNYKRTELTLWQLLHARSAGDVKMK